MSISNSILGRDLKRLARNGGAETQLVGRGNTNPIVLAEWEYFQKHGMTRAQADDRACEWRRQDRIDNAIRDLNGPPPEGICNVKGLGPKRALFARYSSWRHREEKRLSELETRKSEMEAMIAAPAATEAEIRTAVRTAAAALMGRDGGGSSVSRKVLDDRLSLERHTAEAAQEALVELENMIEGANLRVARLNEREAEFLNPAMAEVADDIGLGELYLKKIAELREVSALIFGLGQVAGGYGSGFEIPIAIEMPKPGLRSVAKATASDYRIDAIGKADVWRGLAQSLRLDPRHDASKFIPLPKV